FPRNTSGRLWPTMGLSDLVYGFYERHIQRNLDLRRMPGHVAVMLDGNRRWARAFGAETSSGYVAGAQKAREFLGWCDEVGVQVVTLFLLSTDNLHRPRAQLAPLLEIIEQLVTEL